jgi:hypothetical protein
VTVPSDPVRTDRRSSGSEKQDAFTGTTADFDAANLKAREHRVDAPATSFRHSGCQIVDAWDRTNGGGAGWIVFGFLDADNDRAALCVGEGYNLAKQLVASGRREIPACRPRVRAVSLSRKLTLEF